MCEPARRADPASHANQCNQCPSLTLCLPKSHQLRPPHPLTCLSCVCVCVCGGGLGRGGGVRGVGPVSKQITISMEGGDRYRDFGGGGGGWGGG